MSLQQLKHGLSKETYNKPSYDNDSSMIQLSISHHHCYGAGGLSTSTSIAIMLTVLAAFLTLCVHGTSDYSERRWGERGSYQRADPIPFDVYDKLKRVKNHQDFMNIANILPSRSSSVDYGASRSAGVGKKPDQIEVATVHDDNLQRFAKVNRSHVDEVIEDPTQSDDSCRIFEHCVALPISKTQGYYYFPKCIDMQQCSGGCCDRKNTCHATKIKRAHVKVRVYKFEGTAGGQPNFIPVDEYYVEMDRHLECSCDECQPRECPTKKRWEDCRCVCNNHKTAAQCIGIEKEWSDEKCECRCKATRCGPNQFLEPVTCRCTSINDVVGQFQPNSAAPIKKAISSFRWR